MTKPTISIIIPAYNVERYIQQCVSSALNQTYPHIEVIIIDDASTDNVGSIIDELAHLDERLQIIHTPHLGTHGARKLGLEHAHGEYVFFLDGDDDLQPQTCEEFAQVIEKYPSDIIHFGLTVTAENNLDAAECEMFSQFNNTPIKALNGNDIMRTTFSPSQGYGVDWRFTQRLYRTDFIKHAMNHMSDKQLTYGEDSYECFVASALAKSYVSCKQHRGYVYHYGRGVCGTHLIDCATYAKFVQGASDSIREAQEFVNQQSQYSTTEETAILEDALRGFTYKTLELLTNNIFTRIQKDQQLEACNLVSQYFDKATILREVWRTIRDTAYSHIKTRENFLAQQTSRQASDDTSSSTTLEHSSPELTKQSNTLHHLINLAQQLGDPQEEESIAYDRYEHMRSQAETHLNHLQQCTEQIDQHIRIFVTTHKDVERPKSNILQLVQVGQLPRTTLNSCTYQDNWGENIADKNPMYCELTTQYWAWKNIDADYYGFCHYRRYFNFSNQRYQENPYGEIMDSRIDSKTIAKYGLDDNSIVNAIGNYDVITTIWQDLRHTIDNHGTPARLWNVSEHLHPKDLRLMVNIIGKLHPDYLEDAYTFLNGNRACFCNMFIMRKEIFHDYCEWLFPILEIFEKHADMSLYDKESLRTPGHLAERLLNIYLMHHKRIGSNWKMKELQCVHFTKPEKLQQIFPLDQQIVPKKSIVPVVLAADNNYIAQLTTTMYSLVVNASTNRFYDIVILQRNISHQSCMEIQEFFADFVHVRITFIDVSDMIADYQLTTSNEHISIETYYRFLIQQVLPFYKKVVYLDSDLVVNGDVAELFDTDLGDALIAACHDIDFIANLNQPKSTRLEYATEVLHMKNPYGYFQAGVLVLNTEAMRKLYTIEQWLTYASNPDYIYNDQDVLNACCEGRVKYLDWSWNVMHNCGGRVDWLFSKAPAKDYAAYRESRKSPRIIHYAGFEKPWVSVHCDYAPTYWKYARNTPFYEQLLAMISRSVQDKPGPLVYIPPRAVKENSKLRKALDPIMPLGSRRREICKSIARTLTGKV